MAKMSPEKLREKVEELSERHTEAVRKRESLKGQLKAKKEELEALIKEIRAAGYDPKKLVEERDKKQSDLEQQIAVFEKDLTAVEQALAEYNKK